MNDSASPSATVCLPLFYNTYAQLTYTYSVQSQLGRLLSLDVLHLPEIVSTGT